MQATLDCGLSLPGAHAHTRWIVPTSTRTMTAERLVFYAYIAENDLRVPSTYTSQQPSEAGIIMSLT